MELCGLTEGLMERGIFRMPGHYPKVVRFHGGYRLPEQAGVGPDSGPETLVHPVEELAERLEKIKARGDEPEPRVQAAVDNLVEKARGLAKRTFTPWQYQLAGVLLVLFSALTRFLLIALLLAVLPFNLSRRRSLVDSVLTRLTRRR
jgi:hypothetical protein